MSIETERDLEGMRRAGAVVKAALRAMRRSLRPGITTGELDRVAGRILSEHGARSAPRATYGFPGDALISVNDEAVHGIPGARRIEPGDLVKMDVTVELDGYVADAAVTVAVPPVSPRARRLATAARAAFARAMEVARAGHRVNEIGRAVEAEVRRRGLHVAHDLNGHGVGRAIHEAPPVPNRYDPRLRDRLEEGLVITVEPIVAETSGRMVEDDDGWTIRTADGGWAAHHEHTLVVLRGRPLILTA